MSVEAFISFGNELSIKPSFAAPGLVAPAQNDGFAFRVEGEKTWQWLPQQFDASILSDEATAPGQPNFTGAFVGMACQDMAGTGRAADFDYFEYQERGYRLRVA